MQTSMNLRIKGRYLQIVAISYSLNWSPFGGRDRTRHEVCHPGVDRRMTIGQEVYQIGLSQDLGEDVVLALINRIKEMHLRSGYSQNPKYIGVL